LRSADGLIITLMILGISVTWNSNILDLYLHISKSSTYVSKGPHTWSKKFAQQHVVQQETVSIHDTISSRRLQSLGKCHNKNMSKAACLAVILAYAMEEETICQTRKRSIWPKYWLKRRSVFLHGNLIRTQTVLTPWLQELFANVSVDIRWIIGTSYGMRINDELMTWYTSSQTCPSIHASNCCTTWLLRNKIQTCLKIITLLHIQSNHTTHNLIVCASGAVAQTVWPCMGPLRHLVAYKWLVSHSNVQPIHSEDTSHNLILHFVVCSLFYSFHIKHLERKL
jgi:hypothetical protein